MPPFGTSPVWGRAPSSRSGPGNSSGSCSRSSASALTVAGSVALERALDAVTATVIVAVVLATGAGPRGGLHRPGRAAAALLAAHPVLGAATALVALAVAIVCGVLLKARIAAGWRRFALGFRALSRPRPYLCSVASWQLLSWALRLAVLYWFLAAFHIPGGVSTALLVLTLQIAVGVVSPTPGGAGPQQALIAVALAGSAGATALVAFGAGMQVATILLDVVLGGSALALGGYRVRPRPARPNAAAPRWIEVQAHVRPPGPS